MIIAPDFKMILSVGFCLLCVASCTTILAETQTDVGHSRKESEHIFGYVPLDRRKRSGAGLALLLLRKGLRAVKFLTKGAHEVPAKQVSSAVIKDKPARKFVKSGNYDDAVYQFNKLKPRDVRAFKTPDGIQGFMGTVGDRLIYVKSSHEATAKPTIEILKIGGIRNGEEAKLTLTDIITYGG